MDTTEVASATKSTSSLSIQSPENKEPLKHGGIYASPAVRKYARELGVDPSAIEGSGIKGRLVKEDINNEVKRLVTAYGKRSLSQESSRPIVPNIDFTKYGRTDILELSRIKRVSGPHLQRSWTNIPHVTNHDEVDITELEEFRQTLKTTADNEGIRITILAFVMKVMVNALKKFKNFNASLHPDGNKLILKRYFNIGVAVDTSNGLVVPVIREVERKSIFNLASELGELSQRARDGKLRPSDLEGGCISISSLGGISGTGFTPIVNAPEVAILGLARAQIKLLWNGAEFEPRLILPLSLSYDHRVVDGTEAARFLLFVMNQLKDIRGVLL